MEAPPRLLELERAGPPQVTRACPGERGIQALWRPSARKTDAGAVPRAEGPPRRTHSVIATSGSQGGGTCSGVPPSSPFEQAVYAGSAFAALQQRNRAPNKSPRRMSMLTAFGSACTHSLPLELCGPTSPFALRASVRRHRSNLGVVTLHDWMVTSIKTHIGSRSHFPDASVDPTDARKAYPGSRRRSERSGG
jgi:hypothetical protein